MTTIFQKVRAEYSRTERAEYWSKPLGDEKRWMLQQEADKYYGAIHERAGLKKSQMDIFGKKPKQENLFPKASGEERTPHKYIRRYRGKRGDWEYVYKNKQGQEYAADEHGNALPRHRNWEKGDRVKFGEKTHRLEEIGDTVATLRDEEGKKFTAQIGDIKHTKEEQHELWNQPKDKWGSLLDELVNDLDEGKHTGEYQHGDSAPELERKIKEAKEQITMKAEQEKDAIKKAIEDNGGKFLNVVEDLAWFNDPTTGSTLAMRPKDVTDENVKKHIAQSREEFAKRKKPETPQGGGEKDTTLEKSKKKDTVEMSREELVKEHEHLVYVLKHGTEAQQAEEAEKQEKELKEYKKGESEEKDKE